MVIHTMEGDSRAGPARFTLLVSRFNRPVVDGLEAGALETLQRQGVAEEDITVIRVPGAFELPLVAAKVAMLEQCDAIIALGAVIRGETPHFDYVSGACARGLAKVSVDYQLPVIFGVLTTDTAEQAFARSGGKAGSKNVAKKVSNKGADAALAALEMVSLLRYL